MLHVNNTPFKEEYKREIVFFKLIDIAPLALKGESLTQWRNAVVGAPSPITHKYNNDLRLSGIDFSDQEALTERLAAVMDYDKHCNLQMVLYKDGREEIQKPGRKIIGEMKKDAIMARLHAWTPELRSGSFSAHDLVEPRTLRIMCDAMSALAKHLAQNLDTGAEGKTLNCVAGQKKIFMSLSRLMVDLGEAIVRCDGVEAFVVTSLFLFLTSEEIHSNLFLLPFLTFLRFQRLQISRTWFQSDLMMSLIEGLTHLKAPGYYLLHCIRTSDLGSQKEAVEPGDKPAYDPKCYLCPCNYHTNGVTNPQYTGTFLFKNDYSTVWMDEGEYNIDTFKKEKEYNEHLQSRPKIWGQDNLGYREPQPDLDNLKHAR
ncbi:Galactose-1-phosphate uridylyltransferase [Aspergillus fumigatus Z5]|nr:Galactose-1-phosphate uridylyltransferase [Aspergillus fumigatus Z5]